MFTTGLPNDGIATAIRPVDDIRAVAGSSHLTLVTGLPSAPSRDGPEGILCRIKTWWYKALVNERSSDVAATTQSG